jgi:hypothetical protein
MSKNNFLFSKDGVGNTVLGQASAELGASLGDGNVKGAFKVVASGDIVESTRISKGGINEASIDPADMKGADALFHIEPTSHNTGVPGYGTLTFPRFLAFQIMRHMAERSVLLKSPGDAPRFVR